MKFLGYLDGGLEITGLLWGAIIFEMGLTICVIGVILMVLAMVAMENE